MKILIAIALVLSSCFVATAQPDSTFQQVIAPFVENYCIDCHGAQANEGGLRLDNLSDDFSNIMTASHWGEVIDRLGSGSMPPSDYLQPSTQERATIIEWLNNAIQLAAQSRLAKRSSVSFYQLSNEELTNTLRELLGVELDPSQLIEDSKWNHFERIGPAMNLTPVHIERIYQAMDQVVQEAFPDSQPNPINIKRTAMDFLSREFLAKNEPPTNARIDLWPGQSIRVQSEDIWPPGKYRFRIEMSGVQAESDRAPHLIIVDQSTERILFECDINSGEAVRKVIEFETHLGQGPPSIQLTNDIPGSPTIAKLNRTRASPFFNFEDGYIPWQVPLVDNDNQPLASCILIDQIVIEGPVIDESVNDLRARFIPDPQSQESIAVAVNRFATAAFRRPTTSAEVQPYIDLYHDRLNSGNNSTQALRSTWTSMLCSPDFLFLIEGRSRSTAKLTEWELANRLAYFLWSGPPDQELIELAELKTLSDRRVLEQQVVRMLADPRSRSLSTSFARQWLQLDEVGLFSPDVNLYPEYDKFLERSMTREPIEFFDYVLRRDLSLRELLWSDWTMVNDRLANHYDMKQLDRAGFYRVALSSNSNRGGLLTMAAFLTMTSDGTRHRPVHRGLWVYETMLGKSVPNPPANVEPIEPIANDQPKITVRDRLLDHTRQPSCASCHSKIDPFGLALDHFDAIGRWRERERVFSGEGVDPVVDASGQLEDGRTFDDSTELKQLLVNDLEIFAYSFTRKLATYALRRPLTIDDRPSIDSIVSASRNNDFSLKHIVTQIVLSDSFRNH